MRMDQKNTQNEPDPDKQEKSSPVNDSKKYDWLSIDDEFEKEQRSGSERIKDFFSDHSEGLGCLTFFIAIGLVAWGSSAVYQFTQDKKAQEQIEMNQAKIDAEKMDSTFITTLRPLVPKMTQENAPRVLNAVKHIILIDHPTTGRGLDILCKKYKAEYEKHENNHQFETYLLIKLREDMMDKVSKIQSGFFYPLNSQQHTR